MEWEWDLYRLADGLEVEWFDPKLEGDGLSQLAVYKVKLYAITYDHDHHQNQSQNHSKLNIIHSQNNSESKQYQTVAAAVSTNTFNLTSGPGSKSSAFAGDLENIDSGTGSGSATTSNLKAGTGSPSDGIQLHLKSDSKESNLSDQQQLQKRLGLVDNSQSTSSSSSTNALAQLGTSDAMMMISPLKDTSTFNQSLSSTTSSPLLQNSVNTNTIIDSDSKSQQMTQSQSGPSPIKSRRELSCVKRYWHDLVWLWDFLAYRHPSWILPGLPQRSFILSITDNRKLIAKALWYQDAINELINEHLQTLRVERIFFEWLFLDSMFDVQAHHQLMLENEERGISYGLYGAQNHLQNNDSDSESENHSLNGTTSRRTLPPSSMKEPISDSQNNNDVPSGSGSSESNSNLNDNNVKFTSSSTNLPSDGQVHTNNPSLQLLLAAESQRNRSGTIQSKMIKTIRGVSSWIGKTGIIRNQIDKISQTSNNIMNNYSQRQSLQHLNVYSNSQSSTNVTLVPPTRLQDHVRTRFSQEDIWVDNTIKRVDMLLLHMRTGYGKLLEWRDTQAEIGLILEKGRTSMDLIMTGNKYLKNVDQGFLYPLERVGRSLLCAKDTLKRRRNFLRLIDDANEILNKKRQIVFSSQDIEPETLEELSSEIVVWERSLEAGYTKLEDLDARIGVEFHNFEKKTMKTIDMCLKVWDTSFRSFGKGIFNAGS